MTRLSERLHIGVTTLLGAFALIATGLVLTGAYFGVLRSIFEGSKPTIHAQFKNTATLAKGDPVRVNGVQVGEVKEIKSIDGGRGSDVKMTFDKAGGKLYADARARVTWRSLLGGAFVVEVDPGHARAGNLADKTIAVKNTTTQVELDDVLSTISGNARTGLKRIPKEMSDAFADPNTPATLFKTLDQVAPNVTTGVGALRGQQKDKDLRDLVANGAKAVKALDDPGNLTTVVQGAAATLQTTYARADDIQRTLDDAPGTMDNTNVTLTELRHTLDLADPLVSKLNKHVGEVAPTLAKLRPTVEDADTLLNRAVPLFDSLRPAVRSLAGTAKLGSPLIEALKPSLARLDEKVLPALSKKDPLDGHSTAEMVGPGAGGLALVAAGLDSNGHFLRFPATAGSGSVYLPCQAFIGDPDKTKQIECNDLQTELANILGTNPLASPPGSGGGASAKKAAKK